MHNVKLIEIPYWSWKGTEYSLLKVIQQQYPELIVGKLKAELEQQGRNSMLNTCLFYPPKELLHQKKTKQGTIPFVVGN